MDRMVSQGMLFTRDYMIVRGMLGTITVLLNQLGILSQQTSTDVFSLHKTRTRLDHRAIAVLTEHVSVVAVCRSG